MDRRGSLFSAVGAMLTLVACSSRGGERASSATVGETLASTGTPDLVWLGGTQLAYQAPTDVPVPTSFVVANQPLTVLTDAYPEHAAAIVTLFWANADYSAVGSAAMALASEGAGDYGDNDRFRGTIPGVALQSGLVTHFWVRADGANGQTLYDSRGGANYDLVPRGLSVGWAGNLGAYDAQGGFEFYRVGNLFNSDLSTATGCFWEGADDYQVQALEVYVPGLTDQGYSGDLANVAASLLSAEVWTNLRKDGWGGVPTTCQAGIGNNYVCQLPIATFPEGGGCLDDGPVPPGNYQYKARFSVDGGSTWYWVGSSDGAGGGTNLQVQYDPGCLYSANDPFTCLGSPLFEAGGVLRLSAAAGENAQGNAVLTNTSAPLTLQNLRLVGADTSKFALLVTDAAGNPVVATRVAVAAGATLNFILTYAPTASTAGTLPDMVDVAWDEAGAADAGITTTYALHVRGVAN
jgi:hypothetical protein